MVQELCCQIRECRLARFENTLCMLNGLEVSTSSAAKGERPRSSSRSNHKDIFLAVATPIPTGKLNRDESASVSCKDSGKPRNRTRKCRSSFLRSDLKDNFSSSKKLSRLWKSDMETSTCNVMTYFWIMYDDSQWDGADDKSCSAYSRPTVMGTSW